MNCHKMAISKKSLRTVLFPYDSTRIGVGRWRWRQDFILQYRGGADDRLFASEFGLKLGYVPGATAQQHQQKQINPGNMCKQVM
jgi:hypothetical protein